MTSAANPSGLLQCSHQSPTDFIYRPTRSQVQGEFSQFEAVWPLAMICSCHYSPLLSAHFFKALVWPVAGGYSEEVSGREMGDWALTPNNETHVGDEITSKEGLVEQIGGWTCTYTSADTKNLARTGGVDVTDVWFYLNTHYFLHHVRGKKKHLPPPQGFTGRSHIVPHIQLLIEI